MCSTLPTICASVPAAVHGAEERLRNFNGPAVGARSVTAVVTFDLVFGKDETGPTTLVPAPLSPCSGAFKLIKCYQLLVV